MSLKAQKVDFAEMRELLLLFLRVLQAEMDRASVTSLPLPSDGDPLRREGEVGFTTMACWFQYTLSERMASVLITRSHLEDVHGDSEASEDAFHKALAIANQLALNHNSLCALHSTIRCGADRLVNDTAANSKFGKYLHAVVHDLSITLSTHPLKKWLHIWDVYLSALMSYRSEGYSEATMKLMDVAHEKARALWSNKRWSHGGSKWLGFHNGPAGIQTPLQLLLFRILHFKRRMLLSRQFATTSTITKEFIQTDEYVRDSCLPLQSLLPTLIDFVDSMTFLFMEAAEINVTLPGAEEISELSDLLKQCHDLLGVSDPGDSTALVAAQIGQAFQAFQFLHDISENALSDGLPMMQQYGAPHVVKLLFHQKPFKNAAIVEQFAIAALIANVDIGGRDTKHNAVSAAQSGCRQAKKPRVIGLW